MNRETRNIKHSYLFFVILYITMIIVSFILPFFTSPEYSIVENSLSELGAQNTPYNWIMNGVLMMLSTIIFIHGILVFKDFHLQILVLFIFCISFFLTAVFLHAPIHSRLIYDVYQNEMHSVFSTITGVSFCMYCLVISFITRWKKQKLIAIAVGISTMLLSYLVFIHSDYRGLYQRAIFIMGFGWMLYSFKYYDYIFTKKEYFKIIKRN